MRASPLSVLGVALLALRPVAALAGDATEAVTPAAETATHVAPAASPTVTTGSIDPADAAPASPLAVVGRGVREALTPPPVDPDLAPETQDGTDKKPVATRPPTPEEAAAYSESRDREAIVAFYAARHDDPVWVSKAGLTDKAQAIVAEIARAAEWGLDPKAFDVPAVTAGTADLPDAELTALESKMALVVLKYARFARGGAIAKPSKQLSSFYDRWPQVKDRKSVLEEIAAAGDAAAYLRGLQPRHIQFQKLRHAWLEARRSAAARAIRLPAEPDLKPGDRNAAVAQLRKRLEVQADKPADDDLYDERLVSFVAGFQNARGLETSGGIVDAATRQALAKPQKANAEQLLANMQAWRYLPEDMGGFYVWVNVPEYLIRIVKNGEVIWTERITAGLVAKQTPIFDDEMVRVTFKSKWRVPDSIKVREVWPSLLRGGGLMRQHGLVMENKDGQQVDWHTIDWSKVNMEDYTLWQPPGPRNQLGLVKFSFPSKHYVFMHDTPDKYMFNWTRRANSHGCMRVRNPLDMATLILGADRGWDRAKIDELVKNGPDHNEIELDHKVPVHITYFTAAVGADGKIDTWPDVYGHERRIRQALAGKWNEIAVPPDHLAPLDQETVPRVASGPKKPGKREDSVLSLIGLSLGGP